jgi:hypothetical protein
MLSLNKDREKRRIFDRINPTPTGFLEKTTKGERP